MLEIIEYVWCKMKKCKRCNNNLQFECFRNANANKDGKKSYCKKCENEKAVIFKRTKKGLTARIYYHQKEHSKRRGMPPPEYSLNEFREWIFNIELFHSLYIDWVNSSFDRELVPSVDRLDDYDVYKFENMQVMKFSDNRLKGMNDIKRGNNRKNMRSILQFDRDNNLIKEHYSLNQAERETNVAVGNIYKCCNNIYSHAGGYIWKYKGVV